MVTFEAGGERHQLNYLFTSKGVKPYFSEEFWQPSLGKWYSFYPVKGMLFLPNICRVQEDNSKHYEMTGLLRDKDNVGSGYKQYSLSASCYKSTQKFSLQSSQYLIAHYLKGILQNILLNQMVKRGGDCYLSNSAGMAVSCFIPEEVVVMRSSSVNKQWTTAVH